MGERGSDSLLESPTSALGKLGFFNNTIETGEITPLATVPESQPMTFLGVMSVTLLGYLTRNKCVTKISR